MQNVEGRREVSVHYTVQHCTVQCFTLYSTVLYSEPWSGGQVTSAPSSELSPATPGTYWCVHYCTLYYIRHKEATIHYITLQYTTIHYNTLLCLEQCSAVQCSAVQCSAVFDSRSPPAILLSGHCTSPCITSLSTALYCTLHCTIHCTALYCTLSTALTILDTYREVLASRYVHIQR